jgi:hypothetical protein
MTATHDSREIAAVLLVIQGSLTLLAGLTALPFGIVEPGMRVESVLTVALAAVLFVLSRGLRRGWAWARRATLVLEGLTVFGSVLLLLLPIGAMRGPVPQLANLLLPAVVFLLVAQRRAYRSGLAG